MSFEPLKAFTFETNTENIPRFFNFDIKSFQNLLITKSEDYWQKLGEDRALSLFHLAAKRVPAYKYFLKKNRVNETKIKTIRDFNLVPVTDKHNYVSVYPLKDRSWDG